MKHFTGVCPNNWIYRQGSCYKISPKGLNWNAAKSAYEALGSTLAMIKSQAEQQALGPKITHEPWIGLHRDPKDKSRWMWIDGTQATYTHWSKGEPNSVAEECGQMYTATHRWKWNDLGCSASLHYVCEIKGWFEFFKLLAEIFLILRKRLVKCYLLRPSAKKTHSRRPYNERYLAFRLAQF